MSLMSNELTCGNFSDTPSLKLLETISKGSIGHAFTVCIHTAVLFFFSDARAECIWSSPNLIQWNLRIKDTLIGDNINLAVLSFVERLSSFRGSQYIKSIGKEFLGPRAACIYNIDLKNIQSVKNSTHSIQLLNTNYVFMF